MAVDLNYGVGVEGKNLVLKTLGRVYVKVKDRKYELSFKPEDIKKLVEQYSDSSSSDSSSSDGITVIDSVDSLEFLDYPGNGLLIITRDGYVYYTENDDYTQIPINVTSSNLTLTNLTLSGQLSLTNSNPISISTTNVITNLNADRVDGYHGTELGAIAEDETITGNWTFNSNLTFSNAVSTGTLRNSSNSLSLDFSNGNITCNTLSVTSIEYTSSSYSANSVSGVGVETWVGPEINVTIRYSFEIEDDEELEEYKEEWNDSLFGLIEAAFNEEELMQYWVEGNEEIDIDFWYSIFFTDWDNSDSPYSWTLKDFSDETVWQSTNSQLAQYGLSLNDYQGLIDAYTSTDTSQFTGSYFSIALPSDTPVLTILPNMIVKDNNGNLGYVVERTESTVLIKALSTAFSGTKLVIIGSLCREGGIVFSSSNPSISVLTDPMDETSHTVYLGELSRADRSLSGVGAILSGSQPDTTISNPTIANIDGYTNNTEIIIKNPHITWNGSVFNQDGSGYVSNGNLRWSTNILQIGDLIQLNAGGNATGTILDRLTTLESVITELENRITDLEANM